MRIEGQNQAETAAQGDDIASTNTRAQFLDQVSVTAQSHTNHIPSLSKNKYFQTSHWHFKRNGTKTFHGYITVHQLKGSCFYCSKSVSNQYFLGHRPDAAFISTGFRNWRKAIETFKHTRPPKPTNIM